MRLVEWAVFAALGLAGAGLNTAVQGGDLAVRCVGVGVGVYFGVLCLLLAWVALQTPGYFRFTAHQLRVSYGRPVVIARRRIHR